MHSAVAAGVREPLKTLLSSPSATVGPTAKLLPNASRETEILLLAARWNGRKTLASTGKISMLQPETA